VDAFLLKDGAPDTLAGAILNQVHGSPAQPAVAGHRWHFQP
jgi:hypothetical protein